LLKTNKNHVIINHSDQLATVEDFIGLANPLHHKAERLLQLHPNDSGQVIEPGHHLRFIHNNRHHIFRNIVDLTIGLTNDEVLVTPAEHVFESFPCYANNSFQSIQNDASITDSKIIVTGGIAGGSAVGAVTAAPAIAVAAGAGIAVATVAAGVLVGAALVGGAAYGIVKIHEGFKNSNNQCWDICKKRYDERQCSSNRNDNTEILTWEDGEF